MFRIPDVDSRHKLNLHQLAVRIGVRCVVDINYSLDEDKYFYQAIAPTRATDTGVYQFKVITIGRKMERRRPCLVL